MDVTFYNVSDEAAVLNKTLGAVVGSVSCNVKGTCSILRPVLELTYSAAIANCNYCYIAEWDRYYFCQFEVTTGHQMICRASVDPLMSWKDEITQLNVVVDRGGKGGGYLPDSAYAPLSTYNTTVLTSSGFPVSGLNPGAYCIVMQVVGGQDNSSIVTIPSTDANHGGGGNTR